MAKGKKTGGRNFEKGHTINQGRGTLTLEDKQARALSKIEFERTLNKYIYCTKESLQDLQRDPNLPAIDLLIVNIVLKAIANADTNRADFVLNRLIGKVKEEMSIEFPKPTVIKGLTGATLILGHENKEEDASNG